MAKSRKKRRQQRRNKAEAKKVVIIGIAITIFFLILAYLAFISGQ